MSGLKEIKCLKCNRITKTVRDRHHPSNIIACEHEDCDNHLFDKGFTTKQEYESRT